MNHFCSNNIWPSSDTENISGGSPDSYKTSANNMAVIGVSSVCLQTIQLLVAIEGAICELPYLKDD